MRSVGWLWVKLDLIVLFFFFLCSIASLQQFSSQNIFTQLALLFKVSLVPIILPSIFFPDVLQCRRKGSKLLLFYLYKWGKLVITCFNSILKYCLGKHWSTEEQVVRSLGGKKTYEELLGLFNLEKNLWET